MGLYRLTATQNALEEVDRRTLLDTGTALPLSRGNSGGSQSGVAVTPDGSKIITVTEFSHRHDPIRAGDQALQILDAQTGAPLSAPHHPAVPLTLMGVSPDGSIAYGFREDAPNSQPCAPTGFYFLDTGSGHITNRVTISRGIAQVLVDLRLQRLYSLVGSDQLSNCDPAWTHALTVTEYDIRTGSTVLTRRMAGRLAGEWSTGREVNGERVMMVWHPGSALSPDGSQLTLLDGHRNMLTVLDPQSLQSIGTEKIAPSRTPLQRVADALGLSPRAAEAKGQINGMDLQMQYTPDGQSLLVTGSQFSPDPRALRGQAHSLGIRLIDVRTGTIKAWLHESDQIIGLRAAPDDSAVYSTAQGWTRRVGWSSTLRRHDPATLHVAVSRPLRTTDWWSIYFLQRRG